MLDSLQLRVLRVVSTLGDPPVLFGGSAILGVFTSHRVTYDVDLMWPSLPGPAAMADARRRASRGVG